MIIRHLKSQKFVYLRPQNAQLRKSGHRRSGRRRDEASTETGKRKEEDEKNLMKGT
jgi:hypothetical protein